MPEGGIRNLIDRPAVKWGAGALIVLVLLYLVFRPEAVGVDVEEVRRGPLEVTVGAQGRTRIRDVYVVSAPVTGRLMRVRLDEGDQVIAEETALAVFEPATPGFLDERAAAQARARLSAAQADLEFARIELERAERLRVDNTISRHELDLRRANFEAAKAALEEAEAALMEPGGTGSKPAGACCLELKAEVNGEVLRVLQESERVLQAGTPIMEVGDPHNLEVVVDLLSQDAVRVEEGDPAFLINWGGRERLDARVRRVEPSGFTKISALGVEEQRVNVVLDVLSPQEDWRELHDGYRVEPRIIVWQNDDALRLPLSALFRVGSEWAVFVAADGTASLRRVQVGERNDDYAQVLGGLEEGEAVILHPAEELSDGRRIRVRTHD